MTKKANHFIIQQLGKCKVASPLATHKGASFIRDDDKVLFDLHVASIQQHVQSMPAIEKAGPRKRIFFNPASTRCAIVSCGGLCPGINDVIRGIVMTLHYRYGLKNILGIRYGFQGFIPSYGHKIIELNPGNVEEIHKRGGSILGTSRGYQDEKACVTFLKKMKIGILFVIGGDGTLRGALAISDELKRSGSTISVVGIPKTVDNDILYIDQSFGFETAFSQAVNAIKSAHNESLGAPNGIGLVKLMGRHSGFIACFAALAMNDVNFVLIPEVPFRLEGRKGFFNVLKHRINKRGHAVIVVAEGTGQNLIKHAKSGVDRSGNVRLRDIGLFLKEKVIAYFHRQQVEINLKYIDPSYLIRSVPASPQDSVYCLRLAENAVHAAMCGKTRVIIAKRHNQYVHLPMYLLASGRKHVDPKGGLWSAVMAATGQPTKFA